MDPGAILGIAALVAVGGGVIYLIILAARRAAERERARKAALAAWAGAAGFELYEELTAEVEKRFKGLVDIGRGHDRAATDVLVRRAAPATYFYRYFYKTWETRVVTYTDSNGHIQTRTETYEESHHQRYLMIELSAAFPDLVIRPESWFEKLAALVGFDDIDFESEEFSRRYYVKSKQREFAYAVIHPQMMEYLLAHVGSLELVGGRMLLSANWNDHTAAGCRQTLSFAAGFVERIPEFVWRDYAKSAPLVLGAVPEPAKDASA